MMTRRWLVVLVSGFLFCATEDGATPPTPLEPEPLNPDEIPLKVDKRCPGPGCADGGDGLLYAGVSKIDVSPLVEPFNDKNKNKLRDDEEEFIDRNGNGTFDSYFLAGYGTGRLAQDVNVAYPPANLDGYAIHDPVWARALALRQNGTTVVVVAVDVVGLFLEETTAVRKLLSPDVDVSLLLLHATHCHESIDVVGLWGVDEVHNGVNASYMTRLRQGIAQAVTEAVKAVKPARVSFGAVAVEDANRDMLRYVSDARDPVIIDNTMHTMLFTAAEGAHAPIATLVNWAHHPESVGSRNHLVSSDWVHYLRENVEKTGGGTAVYVSGALGGQIGPGSVVPKDAMGNEVRSKGFPMAEAIGNGVSPFALTALADPGNKVYEGKDLKLAFRTTAWNAHVHNARYYLGAMFKVLTREFCCYDTSRPFGDDNVPSIATAAAYLSPGPASIITNPGELLPELFIGGYDGSRAGTYTFIDTKKGFPPDVSQAPRPPYLIDVMDGERAHRQTWGLTLDFLGYIVPRYNFVLDAVNPYLDEAMGDHYEETNSVGPLAEPEIVGTMRQLVLDGRPNKVR
jgi:hypothetical protein